MTFWYGTGSRLQTASLTAPLTAPLTVPLPLPYKPKHPHPHLPE
jgi:hypothetical protein